VAQATNLGEYENRSYGQLSISTTQPCNSQHTSPIGRQPLCARRWPSAAHLASTSAHFGCMAEESERSGESTNHFMQHWLSASPSHRGGIKAHPCMHAAFQRIQHGVLQEPRVTIVAPRCTSHIAIPAHQCLATSVRVLLSGHTDQPRTACRTRPDAIM
jgi:hypothetical protein